MLMAGHRHPHIHTKKKKDILDYMVYFFMVATPLFELPQLWSIFSAQSAANVSVATWVFFFFASFVWFFYGLRRKIMPMMVANSLYIFIEGFILLGIWLYS